jgi:hypothetical protein
MDGRKVNGAIVRAGCSPAPILSGPFRFLRNILASFKIYRAASKYPSKISPKMAAKKSLGALESPLNLRGAPPRKSKQK